jgi:hypothetical protein
MGSLVVQRQQTKGVYRHTQGAQKRHRYKILNMAQPRSKEGSGGQQVGGQKNDHGWAGRWMIAIMGPPKDHPSATMTRFRFLPR